MSQNPDVTRNSHYYAARAAEERRFARKCVDSKARAAHLEMAERYEILARACESAPEQRAGQRLNA